MSAGDMTYGDHEAGLCSVRPAAYHRARAASEVGALFDGTEGAMASTRLVTWLVGEAHTSDLADVVDFLEDALGSTPLILVSCGDESLPTDSSPGLVVVLQSWSQQYTRRDVNALIRAVGSRGVLLCVYDAWCESDGRNAQIWPHAVRVPARSASERIERELHRIRHGKPRLFLTAGRDERFEFNHKPVTNSALRPLKVCVESADRRWQEGLSDRLRGLDIRIDNESPDVVVADIVDPTIVKRIAQRHRNTRIVGVCAMPTPQATRELRAQGVTRVLPVLHNDRQLLEAVADDPDRA